MADGSEPGGAGAKSGTVEPAIRALHGLIHNEGDHVAVSVRDVDPGPARLVYMDTEREVELDVLEQVPLGHKVALTDLADGADVIEYGARIGLTRRPIRKGELVHVHNLRSARWGTAR